MREFLDPSKAKEEGSFMAMESRMELRPSERHLKLTSKWYTFKTACKIDLIYLREYSQDQKILFNENSCFIRTINRMLNFYKLR